MSKKNVSVYFCPNCKSQKVRYVFEIKNLFGVIPKMRCLDCKTEMPSFPVLTVDKKELNKSQSKKKSTTKKKTPTKKKK